jgi:septal ring factor EnvC (AmiA/AmiB activator)
MHYLVTLCLLLLLLAPAGQAGAARLEEKLSQQKAQAKKIERELRQKRQTLQRVGRQEKSTAQELKALERELSVRERRLAELESQCRTCEADYARAQGELGLLLPQVGRLKQSLGGRVVMLAELEPTSDCAALFGPEHPSRVSETSLYLERLAVAEARTIEAREADAERLRASQELAEAQRRKLAALTEQVNRERTGLARKQAEKSRLLANLGKEKQSVAAATRKLEESRRALRHLIDEVEEKIAAERRQRQEQGAPPPQAATGFAALKGKLPMPVAGRVVSRFGQRDAQGIASTGVDIEAKGGAPIACVWKGRVAYAGMLKGYGNLVVVDHGEGYYSLYGRAGRLHKSEGQPVERGEVLGTVAEGAQTLYFEIRHHRKPQDPLAWLSGSVAANIAQE